MFIQILASKIQHFYEQTLKKLKIKVMANSDIKIKS